MTKFSTNHGTIVQCHSEQAYEERKNSEQNKAVYTMQIQWHSISNGMLLLEFLFNNNNNNKLLIKNQPKNVL